MVPNGFILTLVPNARMLNLVPNGTYIRVSFDPHPLDVGVPTTHIHYLMTHDGSHSRQHSRHLDYRRYTCCKPTQCPNAAAIRRCALTPTTFGCGTLRTHCHFDVTVIFASGTARCCAPTAPAPALASPESTSLRTLPLHSRYTTRHPTLSTGSFTGVSSLQLRCPSRRIVWCTLLV